MKKIYTRSPMFVQSTSGTSVQVGVTIWTGSLSVPSPYTYTLSKTHNSSGKATFEVSDLINDYIEHSFDGDYASAPVYVRFDVDEDGGSTFNSGTLLALEGYTEGDVVQYYKSSGYSLDEGSILMTLGDIAIPENTTVVIPVEDSDSVIFTKDGVQKFVYTIDSSSLSSDRVEYATSAGQSASTFYARVIQDGGTIIDEHCIDDIMEYVSEFDVDTAYVINADGNAEVIKISTFPCTKYEQAKLTFVNKFGALQDIHFSAKNSKSYQFKNDEYKSLNFDYDNLSNNYTTHSDGKFNSNGKTKHTLNTDYLPESYSEYVKELMLSDSVWMESKGRVVPVSVLGKSHKHKTHLNDGLIQFSIEVEESHSAANNIR